MIRISTGKRCMSASENEEKGKGRRTKLKKKLLYEEAANESGISGTESDSSHESVVPKFGKKMRIQLPPAPTLASPKTPLKPLKENVPSTPIVCGKTPTKRCPFPEKNHECPFQNDGQITLQAIGQTLCHISRTLHLHNSKFNYLKDELEIIKNKMVTQTNNMDCESAIFTETPMTAMMSHFPIGNILQLEGVEEKLMNDKDFFQACVAYFASSAEKNSESRTVTSIMSHMLTLEFAKQFTFKGIQRKDHKEPKKAFKVLHLRRVLWDAAVGTFISETVEKSTMTTLCKPGKCSLCSHAEYKDVGVECSLNNISHTLGDSKSSTFCLVKSRRSVRKWGILFGVLLILCFLLVFFSFSLFLSLNLKRSHKPMFHVTFFLDLLHVHVKTLDIFFPIK